MMMQEPSTQTSLTLLPDVRLIPDHLLPGREKHVRPPRQLKGHWTLQGMKTPGGAEVWHGDYEKIEDFTWWCDGREKKELMICFSFKNGHAYMIAGKYELHGHLYFKKIRTKGFSRFLTIKPIMCMRFPDVTREQIEAVERDIEARVGSREISCIELLRLILERSLGYRMASFNTKMIYLQQFARSFRDHGFVDQAGKPVRMQFLLTMPWSWDQLLAHFGALEERFYWLGHTGLWTSRIFRLPGKIMKALVRAFK